MKKIKSDFNISTLVDELEPVRPLDWRKGLIAPAVVLALAIPFVIWMEGLRPDLAAGTPHPMFLLRGGTLLLLGVVCGTSLLGMANPGVGRTGSGWKIAVAAAMLFPLTALILAALGQPMGAMQPMESGLRCLAYSMIAGFATAAPMVWWLRRGAPVAPNRAGWLTGLAAGGLGAFAYGFHCPYNSFVYVGIWYSLAVGSCAVIGRLVVPRLIRW